MIKAIREKQSNNTSKEAELKSRTQTRGRARNSILWSEGEKKPRQPRHPNVRQIVLWNRRIRTRCTLLCIPRNADTFLCATLNCRCCWWNHYLVYDESVKCHGHAEHKGRNKTREKKDETVKTTTELGRLVRRRHRLRLTSSQIVFHFAILKSLLLSNSKFWLIANQILLQPFNVCISAQLKRIHAYRNVILAYCVDFWWKKKTEQVYISIEVRTWW